MPAGWWLCWLRFTTGCGYHTAGHAVQLPQNLNTIAVPAFKNETLTYRIEQMLTASVVREFNTRTRYTIMHDTGDDADATLRGTVLSTTASPLTYDTSTGRAASVLVVVSMRVSLTDRGGKVLYQNPAYLFREQYEVSQDWPAFSKKTRLHSVAFRRTSPVPWSPIFWRDFDVKRFRLPAALLSLCAVLPVVIADRGRRTWVRRQKNSA